MANIRRDSPPGKEWAGRNELGPGYACRQESHPAEYVRVDGGTDGPHGAVGVVFDPAQCPQAAGVVETCQLVEGCYRPSLGNEVEEDRERPAGPGSEEQPSGHPVQLALGTNGIDDDEVEADAKQYFTEAADNRCRWPAVCGSVNEAEEGHQHEEADQEPYRRDDKLAFLPAEARASRNGPGGDQLDSPNKDQGAQGRIEKGGLEAQAEGQGGKGQNIEDTDQSHVAPVRVQEDESACHDRRRGCQSNERADNANQEADDKCAGGQQQANGAPSNKRPGRKERVGNVIVGGLHHRCKYTTEDAVDADTGV